MIFVRRWVRIGLLMPCGIGLMLAGCAGQRSDDFAYDPQNFTRPDPISSAQITQEYRLGPSDVVTVDVYRAKDLSGDLRVDEAGNVTMPLIGQVSAQGKTTVELAATLTAALSQKYYEKPIVNVALKDAAGQRVTVDGAVNSPGVYPIMGKTTLMQAVAMAKGTNANANLRKVVVFRTIQGQRMAAAFDLQSIRNAEMKDPEVYGSDIIIVDGSGTRQAVRDMLTSVPILGLFRPFVL
jgi:polysaccharide export outer membrane protein